MMYPQFLVFWQTQKSEKVDNVSQLWTHLNKVFLLFMNCSWFVYVGAAIVIAVCAYFYLNDRRRHEEMARRRQLMQRAQERPPQKRRPGAAFRDHQIYRHVIHAVSKYMRSPPLFRPRFHENHELKRTRSGHAL